MPPAHRDCEYRETCFSLITLMEAERWNYQSHRNQDRIQLFKSVIKTFLLST